MSARHTRGEFLKAVGAGTAWITLVNTLGCEPAEQTSTTKPSKASSPAQSKYVQTFRSRPDFGPPIIDVTTQAHDTAPGYIFVAPRKSFGQDGLMIIDDLARLVWFSNGKYAADFKMQHYKGKPVLTWWEGERTPGQHDPGEFVILDDSYQEITRVYAQNGYRGNLHEFSITPRDTALFTVYQPLPGDLSSVGGPKDGVVMDGIAQEINIETGEVLFEWHCLDHIDLEESYAEPKENKTFDYFHINSIEIDHDGNLLISARNTSAVYKINYETGEVIWRLSGKRSDFEMGPGTRITIQHDARRQPDGTITIFDNGRRTAQSRGIVLDLDMEKMTASLVREYTHPDELRAISQGNMQVLPNGHVFIGWGSAETLSESSRDGELLFSARLPPGDHSYRAFRFPWRGRPRDNPAVAVESGSDDKVTVYASWNGATEVTSWEVLAGPGPDQLKPIGSVPRDGFETAITAHTTEPYVGVQAKSSSGEVLGTSKAVKPGN